MKILHIISSLKMGGAESLLCDFIAHSSNNFQHEVIFFHDGPNRQQLEQQGIRVHHIKGLIQLYDPIFCIRLYRLIKQLKPDIIHTWLWAANVAGRIIGKFIEVPVINSLHNNVDQDGSVRAFIDRHTPMADHIVPVSHGVAQSLVQRDSWIPATKIAIIQNGIDRDQVCARTGQYKKQRDQLGLTSDHFIIGSVGRLVKLKNYPLLFEAVSLLGDRYPHLRLVLLGTGPEEGLLRKKVQELGLDDKVIFIIGQPAYGYYPLFDCFALSSYKEGISIALLEAMSCGLPCLVNNATYEHDVIEHGNNGLVNVGSVHDYAMLLEQLMIDDELRQALSKTAIDTIEKQFLLHRMITSYEMLYQKIS